MATQAIVRTPSKAVKLFIVMLVSEEGLTYQSAMDSLEVRIFGESTYNWENLATICREHGAEVELT